VAGSCLVLVAAVAGPLEVWTRLRALSPDALLGSLVLHAAIVAALGWRWRAAIAAVGLALPYGPALRLTFVSTLLNLVLPTSVGGDLGRVWLGQGHGIDLRRGTAVALYDRGVGLATLVLLVAATAAAAPQLFPGPARWLLLLAALAGCGAAAVALAGRLPGRAIETAGPLLRDRGLLAATAAVSLASHVAAGGIAALIARGMGVELPLATAVALFPAAILATLVPISVGGWGVRELAAIPLLGRAGIGADAAAAIALAFGLTQLAAAALGTAALSLAGGRERPA
jgi:glycosyltransferase 2 family protein